jgi:hypothetical protein
MISPAALGHRYSLQQHEQNTFDGMRARAAELRDKASALSGVELKLKASRAELNEREIALNAKAEALRRLERKLAKRERARDDRVEPIAVTLPVAKAASISNVTQISFLPIDLPHDFRPGIDLKTAADHDTWQQGLQVLLTNKKWRGEIPHAELPFEPAHPLVSEADHRAWAKAEQILAVGRKWSTPEPEPDRLAVAREALALRSAPSTPSGSRQMRASDVIATARKWCGDNSRFVS